MRPHVDSLALPRTLSDEPQLCLPYAYLRVHHACTARALCVHRTLRLADFFIAKLLGKHSSLDELPSLDETLFSSLDFVKRWPRPATNRVFQPRQPCPRAAVRSVALSKHAPTRRSRAAATMATSRRICA